MVKVSYELEGTSHREEVYSPQFLLTNKKGGYYLDYPTTLYRGMHILEVQKGIPSLFKTIDTIKISNVATQITNKFWCIEKKYGPKTTERFFMHENGLLYEVEDYEGYALLTLDMRRIYDFSVRGHTYEVYEKKDFIIIEYKKHKDDSKQDLEYQKYLVIKTDAKKEEVAKWVKKEFEHDKKRKTKSEWFIYEAMRFNIAKNAKIVFYAADNLERAMNNANYLFYSGDHLKNQRKEHIKKLVRHNIQVSKRIGMAYKLALKSLDDLVISINDQPMIYAGLPWFFQIWTRDEAISLRALMLEKDYEKVKKILFRQLNIILKDGRIPSRYPPTTLSSADGVGWVFKRIHDFLKLLNVHKKLKKVLSREDLLVIKEKLGDSLSKLLVYRTKDGYAVNAAKETWMDTEFQGDTREGVRLEIQCLRLSMYSLMNYLSKMLDDKDYKKYGKLERKLRLDVRRNFLDRYQLKDGISDPTLRPNIFLAYYAYPHLLSNKKWEYVFKNASKRLYLDWGGFSTIEKSNPLFCEEYTGADNKSYHRGDSWFFINNLAAICLKRVNYKMFYKVIVKIVEASTNELLTRGVVGASAEVSSAKELRSEGCFSQAWSAATYIELVHELFEHVKE
ncbi:hypothetical protein GOV05_03620 [Candidatus Woesearchaeota archaeon]|nr:hypothetical protein [Candidatus Woesearchaeota archaeon]